MSTATKTADELKLPRPEDRPGADVIIFDGACKMCRAGIERIRRWDGGRFGYLSLHDAEVARRYPDLTHDAMMDAMHLVDPRGRRYKAAEAARVIFRRIPWFWPLVPLMYLPFTMPLWEWLYMQVASRRYRVFGQIDKGSCDDGACAWHAKKHAK